VRSPPRGARDIVTRVDRSATLADELPTVYDPKTMTAGSDDADARARAARAAQRRGRMVIRKTRLGADDVDITPIRGLEAMALTAELSIAAWGLSGRPVIEGSIRSGPIVFAPRKP
jgi:hypothetical protein